MDKHLLRYPGSKQTMAIVGLLTGVQAVAILFQAIFLAKAITQMFHGESLSVAIRSFAFFFIAHFVRQLMQWGKERIAYRFAQKTSERSREQLVEKLFQLGPDAVGKHGSGNLITLTLEGIPKFRKYIELFIPRFVTMAIVPLVIVLYIWTQDKLSAITLIIVLPVLIIFLILIGLVSQKKIDDQMENYRLLSRHFVDSLRGLVTLKYLGKSKSHEKAIETVSNKYRIATNRALKYAFMSSFALDFFASLSVAIVAVELGLRLINGTVTLEPALAILILAPDYFLPVRELGNDFHATVDGQDAGEEIRSILKDDTSYEMNDVAVMPFVGATSLRAQEVTVIGDEERTLLEDVSFDIRPGEKIGIVGTSGAGKSTFIRTLAGFTTVGDGTFAIGEKQLPTLANESWQRQLSYIPQHPTIFAMSVAENIRFYAPDATLDEVKEAARTVGLYELIESFPNTWDEPIGQAGRSLSGGEEQRVALARTLLQQSNVLLFDEPTAHLDIETEHDIKQIIVPLMEEKTVFFATHRLHWMKNMDRIFVIDHGRVVQEGTYEQLLHEEGPYRALVRSQQQGVIRS